MATTLIRQGVPVILEMTVTKADGSVLVIPSSATVTVAITNERTGSPEMASTAVLSTDTNANWSSGLVTLNLTAAQTAALRVGVYGVTVLVVSGSSTYISKQPYACVVAALGMAG